MSRLAGVAIAFGLLAIAAALALPSLLPQGEGTDVGRFALVQSAPGVVYRIDTTTGDAWISEQGGDWRAIEEPEVAPDDLRPSSTSARASAQRPLPAVGVPPPGSRPDASRDPASRHAAVAPAPR